MQTHTDNEIYLRQLGIVDNTLLTLPIAIVGAGNIGSWVAYNLIKIGCTNVHIYDDDTVEVHNTSSQIYSEQQLGLSKVEALKAVLAGLVTTVPIIHNEKIRLTDLRNNYKIVVSAVDSMAVRRDMFETMRGQDMIFIDGRLGGHIAQVYTTRMNNEHDCELYDASLFPDSEADTIPCGMRSIAYNCLMIAGLIGSVVVKAVMDRPYYRHLELDMTNYILNGGLSRHSETVHTGWLGGRGIAIVGSDIPPQDPDHVANQQAIPEVPRSG